MTKFCSGCVIKVLLLTVVGLASHCASGQEEPDKEIVAAVESWCEALESGDLDRIVQLYDDSDTSKIVLSTGMIIEGIDAIREMYKVSLEEEVSFDDVELSDANYRRSGDVAWVTGRLVARTTARADDSKWKIEIYSSFVLKQDDGHWKIVLDHSTPIKDIPRLEAVGDGQDEQLESGKK